MAGIDFHYVDIMLEVNYLETGEKQYQKDMDEAISAWFRYMRKKGEQQSRKSARVVQTEGDGLLP